MRWSLLVLPGVAVVADPITVDQLQNSLIRVGGKIWSTSLFGVPAPVETTPTSSEHTNGTEASLVFSQNLPQFELDRKDLGFTRGVFDLKTDAADLLSVASSYYAKDKTKLYVLDATSAKLNDTENFVKVGGGRLACLVEDNNDVVNVTVINQVPHKVVLKEKVLQLPEAGDTVDVHWAGRMVTGCTCSVDPNVKDLDLKTAKFEVYSVILACALDEPEPEPAENGGTPAKPDAVSEAIPDSETAPSNDSQTDAKSQSGTEAQQASTPPAEDATPAQGATRRDKELDSGFMAASDNYYYQSVQPQYPMSMADDAQMESSPERMSLQEMSERNQLRSDQDDEAGADRLKAQSIREGLEIMGADEPADPRMTIAEPPEVKLAQLQAEEKKLELEKARIEAEYQSRRDAMKHAHQMALLKKYQDPVATGSAYKPETKPSTPALGKLFKVDKSEIQRAEEIAQYDFPSMEEQAVDMRIAGGLEDETRGLGVLMSTNNGVLGPDMGFGVSPAVGRRQAKKKGAPKYVLRDEEVSDELELQEAAEEVAQNCQKREVDLFGDLFFNAFKDTVPVLEPIRA